MPPLISFETGRKHKFNLLFKTTRWSETANGSLVLLKQEPRLRGQHTRRKIQKELTPALLRSASGELLPSCGDLLLLCLRANRNSFRARSRLVGGDLFLPCCVPTGIHSGPEIEF